MTRRRSSLLPQGLQPQDAGRGLGTSSSRSTAALSAHDVHVAFDGVPIVSGVDLEVRAGEVLALVGPNGAGKSTLLSVLAGDLAPSSGRVHLHGEDLHGLRLSELARHRAVLLQEQRLSFPFHVEDVVRMGRAPWRGLPEEDEDDLVVARSMDVAEVTHLAPRLFPTLSGGEKGRASFARVLAQGTRVLMLDEPTAALDIRHQEAVLVQARDQAAAGDAVVVVLHDLTLAAAYSDVVAVLDAGRLRGYGAPRDVLTSELLTEVYRYPIDVLEHPVRGELVVLPVRERAVTSAAGPATPDHLHDRPTDL